MSSLADIEIELGPTIRQFSAPLPNGGIYRDSLVFPTSGESRQVSDEELKEEGAKRVEAHLAFVNDPEGAAARRDVEENIQTVESLVDLSDPDFVEKAWSAGFECERILNILLERHVVAAPLIAERVNGLYGLVWQRWQSMLG